MHRYYDQLMRDLDRENRKIDRWQDRQHRHGSMPHHKIARKANHRRDALNRERDQLNRERAHKDRQFNKRLRRIERKYRDQHYAYRY